MTNHRCVIVIGATGIVGQGIVRALASAEWQVIAVGRDEAKLDRLAGKVIGIDRLVGSVETEEQADRLITRLLARSVKINAVVTTINQPVESMRLIDTPSSRLAAILDGNLIAHHVAARALVPLLERGGQYLGIGGGMADFTVAGLGAVSMGQAAQRNLFRFLASEMESSGISIAELMLYSMIVDSADDGSVDPRQLRSDEVGMHVRAVLEQPERFPGPILALRSRKQIGHPERTS